MAEVVARAAYPGVIAGGVFQEESVEKIAAIQLDGLVQVARCSSSVFFKDLRVEPDGSEWIEGQQVSIADDPLDRSVETAQLRPHFGQDGLKGVTRALVIHLATEQRQQPLARLGHMRRDHVVEQGTRPTTRYPN